MDREHDNWLILPNPEGKKHAPIRASFLIFWRTPWVITVVNLKLKRTFSCANLRLYTQAVPVILEGIWAVYSPRKLRAHTIITEQSRKTNQRLIPTKTLAVETVGKKNLILTTANKSGLLRSQNSRRGLRITGLHFGSKLGSSLSTPRSPGW